MQIVIDISPRRVVRWLICTLVVLGVIGAGVWWHRNFGKSREVRLDMISPDGAARCEIVDVMEGGSCQAVVTVYVPQGPGGWRQLRQETLDGDSVMVGDLAVDWQLDDQNRTQAVRVFRPAGPPKEPDIILQVRVSP